MVGVNPQLFGVGRVKRVLGVMFGSPETTTGGRALKFYASVRLDVRRIAALKDGDKVIGNRTKAKIVKNKMAPPFREAEFDIIYGQGISKMGELVDLAILHKIVERSGAWISYNGEKIGQGRDNTVEFLRTNNKLAAEIEKKLRDIFFAKPEAVANIKSA